MLILTTPPAAAQAAFAAELPSFLADPSGLGSPAFGGLAPDIPSLDQIGTGYIIALPVFVLNSTDAAKAAKPFRPVPAGWQFFAGHEDGDQPQVILGTVIRLPPQSWKMINMYYGEFVLSELNQLNELSSLLQGEEQNYELRLLWVPVINFWAFWQHALETGANDGVVPIPSGAVQPIEALRGTPPYEITQFMAAIRPLAALNVTIPAGSGA